MQKVYVAAPFSEWRLVREVQAEIRSRGGEVSCDWTADIESLPPGLTDADVSEEQARDAAIAGLRGVVRADACIFLTVADKTLGRGMYVEMGIAIAQKRLTFEKWKRMHPTEWQHTRRVPEYVDVRIAVCGPHRDATIFSRLGKRFADWHDALPYVLGE